MEFAARVTERQRRLHTRVCVGLDPRPELHPDGVDLAAHCREVLLATEPHVCAVKPNLAFFEAQGLPGLAVLGEVLELATELGVPIVLDGKRGDVGSTSEAYARAWLSGGRGHQALTVSPYLGRDGLQPFVDAARAREGGIFVLVRTSNAGADDLQNLRTADGATVAEHVARWCTAFNGPGEGYGPVGAVVGATRPDELQHFRLLLPRSLLLLPGVGAQGGTPDGLAPAFHEGGVGAIVTASRSVEYASRGADFAQAAAAAAKGLKEALNRALGL